MRKKYIFDIGATELTINQICYNISSALRDLANTEMSFQESIDFINNVFKKFCVEISQQNSFSDKIEITFDFAESCEEKFSQLDEILAASKNII